MRNADAAAYLAMPLSADSILEKALEEQERIREKAIVTVEAWAGENKVKSMRTHMMTQQIQRRRNVTEQLEERSIFALRNGIELLRAQMRDTPSTFRPDGFQAHVFPSKDVYEGEWKNTNMHGRGRLTTADGQEYDGDWFVGVRAGNGSFRCKQSNTTYVGRWFEGRRHGKGELTEPEGSYKGEFRDGRLQGNGEYVYNDGHRYRGDWVSDRFEGTGTYYLPSGAKYEGEWLAGLQHGKGFALLDGTTDAYLGDWRNGKRHGRGTLKSSSFTYTGDWEHDAMQGQGKITYATGDVYEGAWDRSLQHGAGTLIEHSGRSYAGEWHYGKRHGKGKWTSANGRSEYDGEWKADLKHGRGTLTLKVVGKISGTWTDDLLDGAAVFYPCSGEKADLVFRNGVCISKHVDEEISKVWLSLAADEG